MRYIDGAERRARLEARHLLGAAKAATPVEVVRSLVALHATGPAAVYLSTWARTRSVARADVDRALYDDRSLVRLLGMRRTVFVVPVELAGVVLAACTATIARRERGRLEGYLRAAGLAPDVAAWLRAVEARTLAALEAAGEATAAELSAAVPELRERLRFAEGKRYAGEQSVSTRVLFLLAAEGHVVRGRPRGSWLSSQYRWAPLGRWLSGRVALPSPECAQAELARRWLRSYGPGSATDLRWWTGWTARETSRALAACGAVPVTMDAGPGFVAPDDVEPVPAGGPAAALLPALDPSIMGWTDRGWFLGPHRDALFDRSGNAGPTVWWGGRVVGGWGQRGGHVVHRLLADVGREAEMAIEREAARLEEWLDGTLVTPPFRTPLELSLAG